ncbi:hypothetical protein I4U23_000360 [Adineta vaga]|nr:hypothetical protein I4U23_000360 [Adineta vaga]
MTHYHRQNMCNMLSRLELLPDEILMIIFKYSGDIINIFRTFLGLNQHFNQILLDKRLHLLTDILHINIRHDYYSSDVFQQVSQQLLSVNTSIDEKNLCQILRPLFAFHIQQKYIQFGDEFKVSFEKFQSIRQQHNHNELNQIDRELQVEFDNLKTLPVTNERINRIESLVLIKGARLQCDNSELSNFNLCQAINNLYLNYIHDESKERSLLINLYLKLFKILLISNPLNLKNKDYVGNGGCDIIYFLIYTVYRLEYFYHGRHCSLLLNMKFYRTTVDLFLFVIQCQKQTLTEADRIKRMMFDMLEMIEQIHTDIFIQTAQWEIVKIILDEYLYEPWNVYDKNMIKNGLKNLIKKRRLDILGHVCSYPEFQQFLNESDNIRDVVNLMTTNRSGREFFDEILNNKSFDFFHSSKSLLFILLDKKERQLFEQLIKVSPKLLYELDEDGNDCLLYICLKVSGCRHRIIEYLIEMGSNVHRKNNNGQDFMNALQLQRNQKLLKHLIEHEII